jgi:hypothetical protein
MQKYHKKTTNKTNFQSNQHIYIQNTTNSCIKKKIITTFVTRWLSGEHNFTIATIAKLSTFFNKPIINVL